MSTKRRAPKLGVPVVKQSARPTASATLDESKTAVSQGGDAIKRMRGKAREVISIDSSSAEEEEEENAEEDDENEDEEEESDQEEEPAEAPLDTSDIQMEDSTSPNPVDHEPSFGDLVLANTTEPIDVADAIPSRALTQTKSLASLQIQPPAGASLGTVLSQALKTNDTSLLESCLQTTDVNTIRATIQRLESPLAGALLQKLAERLHRRPGRAGSLMVWVQWTLVTHGGYLATQRDLMKRLAALNTVIEQRARGLQSLLSLKGKLDMLEAQMELRRQMQGHRGVEEEAVDDEAVIYVEGQSEDEEGGGNGIAIRSGKEPQARDDESEISEEMPTKNGIIADSEDDSEEEDDDEGFLDDEAEETDADTGDEDLVDHDDQDSEGDLEESEEEVPPPTKMQKLGSLFSRKR